MSDIELKDLIKSIRKELENVDNERMSEGRRALFKLESFELDLKFAVTKDEKIEGGLNLQIVKLGGDSMVRKEQVQSIKIRYVLAPEAESDELPGTRAHSSINFKNKKRIRPLK